MFRSSTTITAVEVGTGAIKVMMGVPADTGAISIIGYDEVSSLNRVVKGEVVNVPEVEELLSEVLNNVETVADRRIKSVYLAITGSHIQSTNVMGSVPITSSDRIIVESDMTEAYRNAQSFNLPVEQKKIHMFQRTFLIDENRRASNPEGMVGNKLTADIHVVYGNSNKIKTLCTMVEDVLGVSAKELAFSGIANFYGCFANRDHSNGILIVDIGAGVTEYVVFYSGDCVHSGQVAVGCEHLANDLAVGLKLPINKCREIVRQQKVSPRKMDNVDKVVKVESTLGQPPKIFKEAVIQTIIETRLTELFQIIQSELAGSFIDDYLNMTQLLGDGIILCGGGALVPDIHKIAESVFGIPVKIGVPVNVSGIDKDINSPRYVTPVGLLHFGYIQEQLEKETAPSFRQTAESEIHKVMSLCRKALRF